MARRLPEAVADAHPVGARSVARTVAPTLAALAALVFLVSIIGVGGLVISERAVHELTDELQPASLANEQVMRAMTDAETGVRAWTLSGQRQAVKPYEDARSRLPGLQSELRGHAAGDPAMSELVRAQEEAGGAWLEQYAEVRLARPGGAKTFDPELFTLGSTRFDELREAHARVTRSLGARIEEARDEAAERRRLVGAAMLLVGLLGALLALGSGRRAMSRVADPLVELHATVTRLRGGDDSARAKVEGPQEVRSVAEAINEMAEAQQRAREMEQQVLEELRLLDSAKGDFVSNVSHELRTPLTTIAGYVDLATEEFEEQLDERQQRMLHAVQRNVKRLQVLIEDLLALSRAEQPSIDLQQIDLVDLLHDVVADLRMTAARREIQVALSTGDAPALVLADRGQLSRVFVNLLSNAVKFSHDGAVVAVTVQREDDELVVVVADQGIGVPAGDIDQLGSRFYRASNAITGHVPGTGLGLRIAQTIVDNHGGVMHLESVEGEGTAVTVRLPAQAQP